MFNLRQGHKSYEDEDEGVSYLVSITRSKDFLFCFWGSLVSCKTNVFQTFDSSSENIENF